MPYIGNQIYQSAFVTDTFSGNGTTTAFTMSVAPAGTTNVLVVVSGVVQDPSTYGVAGNTITFSSAPPTGTGNISCRYLGVPVTGITTTAYRTVTEFTATANQTTFTPPSYTVGFINVYRNGVLLGSADYTATNGTTVVLTTGATSGDLVTVESFLVSSVLNAIPNTPGSVTTSNLVDGAVTTAKLATQTSVPMTYGALGTGNASIMKNRIINGAMVIDQRNAGASVTPAIDGYSTVDRWSYYASQASKFTFQQNKGSVTPAVGFSTYLGMSVASAVSSGTSDYFLIQQPIEGFNTADLNWGTANAKTVTLSFQVYSSLTGQFGGTLNNSGFSRSYPFSFTVSSANTWTTISITIAGDTSGTWLTNNGVGIYVVFDLGCGATWLGTAGSWSGGNYRGATGDTKVVATSGATFYITGVQLEVGSSATGYEYRQYGQELYLCRRYAFLSGDGMSGVGRSTTQMLFSIAFPQEMRTTPSATIMDTSISISDNYVADFTSSGSTIDLLQTTSYGGRISFSGFTGLTQGRWYAALNNTNGYIVLFTAEL